jgi:hypothetical protein
MTKLLAVVCVASVLLTALACAQTTGSKAPAAAATAPAAKPAAAPAAKADDGKLPPDSEYVVAKDGHLSLNGQRVRYWAAIGKPLISAGLTGKETPEQKAEKIANSRKGTDMLVQRFIDLGFNANRFWGGLPNQEGYVVGDGSDADCVDYWLSQMKKRGLKVWLAGLNKAGSAKPDDAGIIDDAATAEGWKKGVAEGAAGKGGWDIRNNPARIWDPRLEAIAIKNMQAVATHFNKHTGLRWCDDPVFAVWELSNEEWWVQRMRGGSWQKLPAFFRNQLIAKWNEFLKNKYGSDEKLKAAWKDLLPGEGLASGTVLLAPMAGASKTQISINDASEQAREALTALKQEYKREDFDPQRGSDVLEFFTGLLVSHKQREAAALRPLGKSTRLCTWVYDTGTGYDIQSQYLHSLADAVAHDAYVNGTGPTLEAQLAKIPADANEHEKLRLTLEAERNSVNVGPWINWLLKPPGICQGVPWLEHNKIEGKPYFAYETQIQQPAKYRADFPLRLAALASIQDWDFICWHYFAPGDDVATNPRPFDKPMDITTGTHPQGYHFTFDEVQTAMMRAAGLMWRQELIAPAATPTKFIYGRKSLYDVNSMPYGGSYGHTGLSMMPTVYQYGARIEIDPKREDDQVVGPVVKVEDRATHNPYTPTKQITFDWKKGFLMMDAPSAVSFTGLMANYGPKLAFANGVELSDVTINNPPEIFEPVKDDEKYISFALLTADGAALDKCKKATVSLVSTSFNKGFVVGGGGVKRVAGTTPVQVARVGGKITAKQLAGMKYTFLDWHMQPVGNGQVGADGVLTVPNDKPIFCVELSR